jgi:hypothetical protein
VEPIDVRTMMNAAAGAVAMNPADGAPRQERRKRLSPAALAVTNEKVQKAYSTVVIAGVVRIVDFLVLSAVGLLLYFWYVMPAVPFRGSMPQPCSALPLAQ